MSVDLIFISMLTGHVIGDFYFQSNKISREKNHDRNIMLLHGVEYSLCVFATLFLAFGFSRYLVFSGAFISIVHLVIDIAKKHFLKKEKKNSLMKWIKAHSFCVDQILHLSSLALCWRLWGGNLTMRWYLTQEYSNLPANPLLILSALLIIIRPVGILIENGEIWDFTKKSNDKKSADGTHDIIISGTTKDAGKMIGYLERIIIFFFMVSHQYGAVAFVLTAKSIARYEQITKEKITADYYLIGTLLSVVSVIATTFILGLS